MNYLTLVLLITIVTDTVYGQKKQPQVQTNSIRSPVGMKVDGKLKEWPSPNLNAFNATNRIYYVVSNDDDNLYFTIRGMGNGVAKKAIAGGMVLTITKAPKKKSNEGVSVLFPLPQKAEVAAGIMGIVNQVSSWTYDEVANKKQIDSIVFVANQLLGSRVNEIGINGIKEIPESSISKYNEFGIKTEIQFFKMQPIIEVAIPLKYLIKLINNADKISYNIKLNAVPEQSSSVAQAINDDGNVKPNVGYALNSTDFWGEYVLAKKPQ